MLGSWRALRQEIPFPGVIEVLGTMTTAPTRPLAPSIACSATCQPTVRRAAATVARAYHEGDG